MREPGARWGVELLIAEAGRFCNESRYAEALRAAEKAREGAQREEEIGLEVRATMLEAEALKMLGRDGNALARYSWILGVAEDPAHRSVVAEESVAFDVVTAFSSWADCATRLPQMQVDQLFAVLDAGERFARAIGKPTWRAGLLHMRAKLMQALGQSSEAIPFAEEGLALKLRDRTAPGATLGGYRGFLADLLREVGRFDEAQALYQTMLDDAKRWPFDRFAAFRGLGGCALHANEAAAARGFADEAMRIAEPMGDSALSRALTDLIDACLAQGDIPAARATSDRHVELATRHGVTDQLFFALGRAAQVALAEGDPVRARTFLTEAQPHADALDRSRNRNAYNAELDGLRAQLAELEAETSQ